MTARFSLTQSRIAGVMGYFNVSLRLEPVTFSEITCQTVSERSLAKLRRVQAVAQGNIIKLREWRGRNDPTADVVKWRVSSSLITQYGKLAREALEAHDEMLAKLREDSGPEQGILPGLESLLKTTEGGKDVLPF